MMSSNIFLDNFIKQFNSQSILSSATFSDLYENEIIKSGYNLKKEISENLLSSPVENNKLYLDYVDERIKIETVSTIDSSFLDKWIKMYKVDILNFPFIENPNIEEFLSTWVDKPDLGCGKQAKVRSIQKDFYLYAFHLERTKILEFIESKRSNINIKESSSITEKEVKNQFTVNQAIILLEKLGVLNVGVLENVPNVKRAILLSKLLGRNEKNIKSALENLNKKPSLLKEGYKKDLATIQQILDNL